MALVVATEVAIPCLLISYFFSTNLRRAFQAWLPTILTLIPAILIVLAFRQFAFEAFACPTNAMAPTILGYHATGKCDECGETCFGPPPNMRHRRLETHTICSNYHLSTKETVGRGTDGDRFLVSKFLTPKRWDAMVFRYPEDPTMLYVMRVVGMPGDDLYIHDGKVWVNGKPLSPPAHLNGIEYASDFPSFSNTLSGTIENPAELADDEYFVLGDFTTQSKDSRFWQTANNGRPPYSVPASSVYGIVTHIYWPPSRMTTLR